MNTKQRVFYNTVVQVVGKILTTLILFAALYLLTRYLGVSGYGDYTVITTYLGFFGIILDMGLYLIIMREVSQGMDAGKLVGNLIVLKLILATFILPLAFLISFLLPYSMLLRFGILIGSLFILFVTLNQIVVAIFGANLRMDLATLSDIFGRLIFLGGIYFCIYLKLGLLAIIWTTVISHLVILSISFLFSRKFTKIKLGFDWNLLKRIIKETLPLSFAVVFGLIYWRIDTIFLSIFKTSKEVGIYGAPYKLIDILSSFPMFFAASIFPIISKLVGKDLERIKSILSRSIEFLLIFALPMTVGILFLAVPIMEFIVGPDYASAYTISFLKKPVTPAFVLQILIFATALFFIEELLRYSIVAFGKQNKIAIITLGAVLFNVVANLIVIPKYSYLGAALVTVFTSLLTFSMAFYFLNQYAKISFSLIKFLKICLAAFLMGVFLYLFPAQHVILRALEGGVIYIVILYLLGEVRKEEIKTVWRGSASRN